jgi:hypothetical protein
MHTHTHTHPQAKAASTSTGTSRTSRRARWPPSLPHVWPRTSWNSASLVSFIHINECTHTNTHVFILPVFCFVCVWVGIPMYACVRICKHHSSSVYHTLHHTALHYTSLHYTTLHYTALHYTTLHYTTLYYTTLYYTGVSLASAEMSAIFTRNISNSRYVCMRVCMCMCMRFFNMCLFVRDEYICKTK